MARVSTKAAMAPESSALGRATVLPVTSLAFSMAGIGQLPWFYRSVLAEQPGWLDVGARRAVVREFHAGGAQLRQWLVFAQQLARRLARLRGEQPEGFRVADALRPGGWGALTGGVRQIGAGQSAARRVIARWFARCGAQVGVWW